MKDKSYTRVVTITYEVGYHDAALELLGHKEVKKVGEGNFKYIVADSFEEAKEIMRRQIADYLKRVNWLNANLDDFWFSELHSEIEDGLCWSPSATYCHKYRVSDLKKL